MSNWQFIEKNKTLNRLCVCLSFINEILEAFFPGKYYFKCFPSLKILIYLEPAGYTV